MSEKKSAYEVRDFVHSMPVPFVRKKAVLYE